MQHGLFINFESLTSDVYGDHDSDGLPRVGVTRGWPYSPPHRHRAGRYYTGASSPGRYDHRDSFAHP